MHGSHLAATPSGPSRRQPLHRPWVVAHRGGRGLAPENTLAACSLALALGVDAVEVDARLSADGVPIILHDGTLDRTTDGHGPVARLADAALRRLDATVGPHHGAVLREPPPRLAEVLALVAGRIAVHVELKGDPRVPPRLVEAVLGLLEGHLPPPLVLSFDWQALALARRLAPAIQTEALLGEWPSVGDGVLARLAGVGASWLGLRYELLTAARARQARDAGLRLNVWTVNRRPAMVRATRLSVDAITTDWPDRLLALLASTPTTT